MMSKSVLFHDFKTESSNSPLLLTDCAQNRANRLIRMMNQIEFLNSRCSLLSLVDNILAEFRKRIDDVSNFRYFCIKNVLWRKSLGNSRAVRGQNALNSVSDDCLQIRGAGTESSGDGEFFSILSDDSKSFSVDG